MSCGALKESAEAAKKAVIQALNDNMETNTLSELWRHYLGLRNIAENHKHKDEHITFGVSSDFANNASVYAGSGIIGGMGDDHISFDVPTGTYAAADTVDFNVGYDDMPDLVSFTQADGPVDSAVAQGELPPDTIKLG